MKLSLSFTWDNQSRSEKLQRKADDLLKTTESFTEFVEKTVKLLKHNEYVVFSWGMYYVQFFCDKRHIYSDFPLTPYRPGYFLKYDVQKVLHEHEIYDHLSKFQGFRYHGWYTMSEMDDGAGEVGETLLIFLKKDYQRAAEICTDIFTQVFEFEAEDFLHLKTVIGSWNDDLSPKEKLIRLYNSFFHGKQSSAKPLQPEVDKVEAAKAYEANQPPKPVHPKVKPLATIFFLGFFIIGIPSMILIFLGSNSEGTPTRMGTIGLEGLVIAIILLFGGSIFISLSEKIISSKSQIREILVSIKVAFNQKLESVKKSFTK